MERKRDIFISYCLQDQEKVLAIKAEIEQSTGAKCWMDLENQIGDSPNFTKEKETAVTEAPLFLFMLSENSQDTTFAREEITLAQKKGKRIVIVNIDGCRLSSDFIIHYYQYYQCNYSKDREKARLLRDISSWLNIKEVVLNANAEKPEPKAAETVKAPEPPKAPKAPISPKVQKTKKANSNTISAEEAWKAAWNAMDTFDKFVETKIKPSDTWFQPVESKSKPEEQWYSLNEHKKKKPVDKPQPNLTDEQNNAIGKSCIRKLIVWGIILWIIYIFNLIISG